MEAFRRIQNINNNNKGIPEFNEDAGADISELTSGTNVSFDDITHIRNKGIYNSSSNLDTAPIIPTLGSIGSASSFNNINPSKLNNVQYRKQMNQQKKMAMLNGARANSLATNNMNGNNNPMFQGGNNNMRANSLATGAGNPMLYSNNNSLNSMNNLRSNSLATDIGNPMMQQQQQQQQHYQFSQQDLGMEPRSMSMAGNNPRGMQMQGGYPRTMSLNPQGQNGMNPYQQQQQQQNFQQQRQPQPQPNQNYYNQNQNQMSNGAPRTMSLMGLGPGGIPGNQNYPRTKSLGGGATLNQFQQQAPPSQQQPQQYQQGPPLQNQMYSQNSQLPQRQNQQFNRGNQLPSQQMSHQQQPYQPNQQYPPYQSNQQQFQQQPPPPQQNYQQFQQQPTGSHQQIPNNQYMQNNMNQFVPPAQPQYTTQQKNSSDSLNDVIEEDESPHHEPDEQDVIYKFDEEDNKGIQISRKSTLKKNNSTRVRKLNLFNDNSNDNDSDAKSTTTLRRKKPPISPYEEHFNNSSQEHFKVKSNDPKLSSFEEEEKELPNTPPDEDDETIRENDSVTTYEKAQQRQHQQPHPIYKQPGRNTSESHSIKNLVANTAFNNFRSPSITNNSNFAGPGLMKTDSPTSYYEASQSPLPLPVDNNSDTDESEFRKQDHPFYPNENNENNGNTTPPTASTSNISQHKDIFGGYNNNNTIPNLNFNDNEDANDTTYNIPADITEPIQDIPEEQRQAEQNRGEFIPIASTHENPTIPSRTPTSSSLTSGDISRPNAPDHRSTSESTSSMPVLPKVLSSASLSSQQPSKKEKRSSFSGKNFLKRLSKSKRSSVSNEDEIPISSAASSRRASLNQRIPSSSTIASISNENNKQYKSTQQTPPQQPLTFTKEEMHIMNCNSELLNELELITKELASSIKRELSLENKLSQQNGYNLDGKLSPINTNNLQIENLEKSQKIVELQEKLNKEKRLRFISEQHALLQENGLTPSPLKLNYEKTEIYNQLLLKNDEVNQLNLKIKDMELTQKENQSQQLQPQQQQNQDFDNNLIEKFQILKFDNEELKNQSSQLNEEIVIIKQQRDELRDVINKLSNQNYQDTKILNDKIKNLELKITNLKNLNSKLSNR
ncbi:hypothetical protein KGF54_001408 [Candida jiufengensis]|uniref:uncharacterized protein n=1 Tax=Candida jiufengensis TaxID=497108 RepID=UPI002224F024|nr:uncharacterized protein KGF54_001408 [Candida jiufengensis]KAI5955906.1 hypothetical protein KGF54_001408 [Candida jiufengensis]